MTGAPGVVGFDVDFAARLQLGLLSFKPDVTSCALSVQL